MGLPVAPLFLFPVFLWEFACFPPIIMIPLTTATAAATAAATTPRLKHDRLYQKGQQTPHPTQPLKKKPTS